jgi:hypothetical protein
MVKPQIGKRYTLRNGLTTSPLRKANNGTNYKFEADVDEPPHKTPSVLAWLKTGEYLFVGKENRYDIIKEL